MSQILFNYSHLWKKEHTGQKEDFTLKSLVDSLVRRSSLLCSPPDRSLARPAQFDVDFECYLVAKHRLIKLSDDYWDERCGAPLCDLQRALQTDPVCARARRFELYNKFKYFDVAVWCVHHDSPSRRHVLSIYNEPYSIDDFFD